MTRCRVISCFSLVALGCAAHRAGTQGESAGSSNRDLDVDRVEQLFPSAEGSSFRLGQADLNRAEGVEIERHTPASLEREGELSYWSIAAHELEYSSGGSGKTIRVHIHASGGEQHFTWQTQQGFLSSARDLRNQEFTAYVRVHGIFDTHRAAISLKIRGGGHTTKNTDLASCTMLTFAPANARAVTRFGKELRHPEYDYVALEPRFSAALEENRWFGLKLVSYAQRGAPASVMNQLYVDPNPFDEKGLPRNGWRLLSEYRDVEGKSTGRYDKLVDWGGYQTTLRTDGVTRLDLAILSVREIAPPPR